MIKQGGDRKERDSESEGSFFLSCEHFYIWGETASRREKRQIQKGEGMRLGKEAKNCLKIREIPLPVRG